MASRLEDLFIDKHLIRRIQDRLPILFYIAEIESSRAGHAGMEVGSVRESILIALLVSVFKEQNVKTDIPITESEIDLCLFDSPISIKTKTGVGFGGIKACWTVDAERAHYFAEHYKPTCDILLAQIVWGKAGGLFYIPIEVQEEILHQIGIKQYLRLPKPNTNPRGIEIDSNAFYRNTRHPKSKNIPIFWKRPNLNYNKYERWVNYWKAENLNKLLET